ncbi:MAG: nucleotidyltransferase domain-containing protein, partial [Candidatus Methanomethylicia archaeon]
MDLDEILFEALKILKPNVEEKLKIEKLLNELLEHLRKCIGKLNLNLEVEVEGSIAKDTWLSGEQDIDVFILFPKNSKKEDLKGTILRLAECIVGDKFIEAYA